MRTITRTARRTVAPVDRRIGPVWTAGIVALVLTKTGDYVTTVLGLVTIDGLVERNPVAASTMESIGLAGLFVLSLLGISAVVLVVEWSVSRLHDTDDFDGDPTAIYLVSYVPLSMLYGCTTVQNVALILTAT